MWMVRPSLQAGNDHREIRGALAENAVLFEYMVFFS